MKSFFLVIVIYVASAITGAVFRLYISDHTALTDTQLLLPFLGWLILWMIPCFYLLARWTEEGRR